MVCIRSKVITYLCLACLLLVTACEDSDSDLERWQEEQGLEHEDLSWEELREMKRNL